MGVLCFCLLGARQQLVSEGAHLTIAARRQAGLDGEFYVQYGSCTSTVQKVHFQGKDTIGHSVFHCIELQHNVDSKQLYCPHLTRS